MQCHPSREQSLAPTSFSVCEAHLNFKSDQPSTWPVFFTKIVCPRGFRFPTICMSDYEDYSA